MNYWFWGKIFLFNLLDTRFFQFSVIFHWIFIGFNIYFYYYYQNFSFLLLFTLAIGNLCNLFYEDYKLFNLQIQKEILNLLTNQENIGIICFDLHDHIIFHNEGCKKIFPKGDFLKLSNFVQYFKEDNTVMEELNKALMLCIKEKRKIQTNWTVNKMPMVFFLQPLTINGLNLFSLTITLQSLVVAKSAAVMDDILNQSKNGYFVVDFRRKIIFCNEILCQWLSAETKDIKYLNITDILGDKNYLYELFDAEKKHGFLQLKWKETMGEFYWEKEVVEAVVNKQWHAIFRLYEHNPVVEDFREKEIINRVPVAIISFKNAGEILMFNNNCQQIITTKLNKNLKINDIIPGEVVEKALAKTRTILGENFYDMKTEGGHFNSAIKKIRIYPLDLGGLKVFFIFNISEFFLQEQQLFHAQRLSTTGEILSGVIHDLNNYLMSILGYAESIFGQMNIYDPVYTNMMHLQNNAVKASNLIRYLLNMSRKNEGTEVFISNCNSKIGDLLRSTAKILGKNIEIKFKYDHVDVVKIGEIYFEQILTNLLINSRDAILEKINKGTMEKGLIYITTEMTKYNPQIQNTTLEKNYVKITIQDNGIGITPINLTKVFDAFYTTKKQTGVGLGLATVKKIIEEHQGTIQIESQEGIGTTIIIRLPTEEKNSAKVEEKTSPYITGNTDIVIDSGTILILEDEQSIRRLLNEQLKRIGYDVIESESGKEALIKMQNYNGIIDVLISDVMLPDMSLVELCKKIKDKYPEIIIILSSGTTLDQVEDIVGNNFTYTFFNKPFPLKTMFSAIQKLKHQQLLDKKNKNKE